VPSAHADPAHQRRPNARSGQLVRYRFQRSYFFSGADRGQQWQLCELFVGAFVVPDAQEAGLVAE
jgi:hypothetical protein